MTKNYAALEGGGSGGGSVRVPVAVAVVVEESRILIAHRFPDPRLPDLWEFPGGKIEPGETPEKCAIREAAEELGIEIEIVRLLLRRPYDYADSKVDLWFFVSRRVSGTPRALGCREWRWIHPDDLLSYPFPDGNEPVLAALRAGGWVPPAKVKEGEVLARGYLAPEVIELIVRPPSGGDEGFRAGQYLMVDVGTEEPRAYSIASPPGGPAFELCIKRMRRGPGSDYVAALAAGDRIRYTGPHGSFVIRDVPRDRLFIATGTGVAPLRSMIRDTLEKGRGGTCELLFGARAEDDLIYYHEFRALERFFPEFRYHPCLSRPSKSLGREARHGRVTTLLPELIPDARDRDVYLCGSSAMIEDAIAILSRLGCDPARCFTEAWY